MKSNLITILLVIAIQIGFSQGSSTENPQEEKKQTYNQPSTNQTDVGGFKVYMGTHISQSAPISIVMGTLKDGYGFYSAFRGGFKYAEAECDINGIIGEPTGSFYFTGEESVTRVSFTVGFTKKWTNWLWWYAAAGYGNERYYHVYDEYSSFTGSYYGTTLAEHTDYKRVGLEWESGLITYWNGFSINMGYTCLNFSSYNLTFGLGFAL